MWIGSTPTFFPTFLVRNGKRESLENDLIPGSDAAPYQGRGNGVAATPKEYAPELILREALQFIDTNKSTPFFLQLALNTPHANTEGIHYGRGMETPELAEFAARDWPPVEKGIAWMIKDIDRTVARVIESLRRHGIERNTLVLFRSDNGPHNVGGHSADYFDSNGPLRGYKRDLYEGGIRVPTIAWWPGKIDAGSTTSHLSGHVDYLATFCDLASILAPKTDGISFVPTLVGRPEEQAKHDSLYFEFYEGSGKQALVTDRWKAVRLDWKAKPNSPIELYDLDVDPAEQTNVVAEHPELSEKMQATLATQHQPHTGATRLPDRYKTKNQ